jgi:hypothetical protein
MKTNLRTISSVITLSSLVASLAACSATDQTNSGEPSSTAAGEDESSAQTTSALLEVELESGHKVSFYEPVSGNLFLVESMTREQKSALAGLERHDALEVFRSIRPDAEVPAVLLAAYERAKVNVGAVDTGVPETAGSNGTPDPGLGVSRVSTADGVGAIRQAHSTSSAADFVNNHGGCTWASVHSFCRVNWANGFTSGDHTAPSAVGIVDHYAGNGITVQLIAGATSVPFGQSAGTIQTYSWGLQSGNINRRLDILNASGDSFHAGVRWQ